MTSERVRYIYRLKPGAGAAYDDVHARVPDDLLTLIKSVGIRDYTIWRHDEIVVCEFEATRGYRATIDALAGSPVQREWTRKMMPLFDSIDNDGEPLWLREVFRLD